MPFFANSDALVDRTDGHKGATPLRPFRNENAILRASCERVGDVLPASHDAFPDSSTVSAPVPWIDRTGPHTVPKEIFARIFVFSVHFAMLRAFQAILRGQSGCGQGGAPSCILIGDTGRKKSPFRLK